MEMNVKLERYFSDWVCLQILEVWNNATCIRLVLIVSWIEFLIFSNNTSVLNQFNWDLSHIKLTGPENVID